MATSKSSSILLNVASVVSGSTVITAVFDIFSTNEITVGVTGIAGGNGDYMKITPVGYLGGFWYPFPNVASPAGGDAGPSSVRFPPFTDNLPVSFDTASTAAILFYTNDVGVLAGNRVYGSTVLKTNGFTKVAFLLQPSGANDILNVVVTCGSSGSV